MDTSHSILRSAKYFFAGTALSRLSGLFRDMAMAFCFGGAPEIAAFMVAYRLANLLRRLFGEGNLQSGFVPHFETLRAASPQAAFSFYRDSAYSLFALLSLCVLAIEGILWLLLGVLPAGWREIAELTMWMAPGLLFICLSALNSALLQCQKKYFISAITPVLFNSVWIAAVLMGPFFFAGSGPLLEHRRDARFCRPVGRHRRQSQKRGESPFGLERVAAAPVILF